MLRHLARDQKLAADLQFFLFHITGELDHFHAVQKRIGNCVQVIGRGDKQHLRKIVIQFQVVIGEGIILFGIQYLKQGRGGIAAKIETQFVDLIEHKQAG